MGRRLVVVGAGGHGRELLMIALAMGGWDILGLIDHDPERRTQVEALGLRFLGDRDPANLDAAAVIGVGDEASRARVDAELVASTVESATLVHPGSTVGAANDLGPGVVLFPGARLTTNVILGRHVHLNVNTSVSHDCVVGDHTTISPGAVIAGSCRIGRRVLVGAGAVVLQGRTVGDGARIGAGAVVVDDVPANATVVGVPAAQRPTGRADGPHAPSR